MGFSHFFYSLFSIKMNDTQSADVSKLIESVLADGRMELIEITCRPQGRQLLIQLLVDTIDGVTIQQCANVNQLVGKALEEANIIEESYTVEVSSPGLDRPLVTIRDFERALGQDLQLSVAFEEGHPKDINGMLLAVQAEAVVLQTTSGNLTVPISQIQIAKKALRWKQ